MPHDPPVTPCLWFASAEDLEAAAALYVALIPASRVVGRVRVPGAGAPLLLELELAGRPFVALNGGPGAPFTPAVSLVVYGRDQDEVDRLWEGLGAGGMPGRCGWLTDRFGLSWQVLPAILPDLMRSADPATVQRVFAALMGMGKLDVAALQRAHDAVDG